MFSIAWFHGMIKNHENIEVFTGWGWGKTADYIRGIMKPDIHDYRKIFYQKTITNLDPRQKSNIVEKGS